MSLFDWLRSLLASPDELETCQVERAVLQARHDNLKVAFAELQKTASDLKAVQVSRFPAVTALYLKQLRFAGSIHELYLELDQPDILGTDTWQTDWVKVYEGIVTILEAALSGQLYPDVPVPPDIMMKWNRGDYQ